MITIVPCAAMRSEENAWIVPITPKTFTSKSFLAMPKSHSQEYLPILPHSAHNSYAQHLLQPRTEMSRFHSPLHPPAGTAYARSSTLRPQILRPYSPASDNA